jgi:uncharacterized protein
MTRCIVTFSAFILFVFNIFSQDEPIKFKPSGDIINEAIELHDADEYEKAIALYNQIAEGDTNYNWAVYEKSFSLLAAKQFEKAIEWIEYNLDKYNEHGNSLYGNLGTAYDELDQSKKAVEVYLKGISLYPMDYNLYFNLGITYEKTEQYAKAVEAYKQSLYRNIFHSTSHLRLAEMAANEGKLAMAMMSYDLFLLMEPTSDRALNVLVKYNEMVGSNWKGEPKGIDLSPEGEDNFTVIDQIIRNRIALEKKYKTPNKLTLPFVKQNYALFESLDKISGEGFWVEFYVPFFQAVYKDNKFNDFAYYMLLSANQENIVKVLNKNEGKIKAFPEYAGPIWRQLHQAIVLREDGSKRDAFFVREGSKVKALGQVEDGNLSGLWKIYHENGSINRMGEFGKDSKETGIWKYYFANGRYAGNSDYKNGEKNGLDSTYFKNGNLKNVYSYVNDVKDGKGKGFNWNGSLNSDFNYKSGEMDGKASYYSQIGHLQYDVFYNKGEFDGPFKQYYDSGELYFEVIYENGKRQGPSKAFYRSGQLISEYNYKENILDGPFKRNFRDGSIQETGQYLDGKLINENIEYYENGNKLSIGSYDENGKETGLFTQYNFDGSKRYELVHRNGEIVAYRMFNRKGEVLKDEKKKRGRFLYESFYPDGIREVKGIYEVGDEGKDGKWEYYDQNGTLTEIENYNKGVLQGDNTTYFINGKVISSMYFEKGKADGLKKEYFINGQLLTKGYWVGNERAGTWNSYNTEGTLTAKKFYLNSEMNGPQYYYNDYGKLEMVEYYEKDYLTRYWNYDTTGKIVTKFDLELDSTSYDIFNYFREKKVSITWKNNVKHGPSANYYANGNKKIKQYYFNGERHGKITVYNEVGGKQTDGGYYYGMRHGLWTEYWENGKTKSIIHYEYGNVVDSIVWYNENGTLSASRSYANNMKHGRAYYYDPDGVLQQIRIYDEGKIVGYTYAGKDGELLPVIPLENETATIKSYFANGNVSREYRFEKGLFQGEYKQYYTNGRLYQSHFNKDSEQQGDELKYYSNGVLKELIPYKDDVKHGVQKVYRKDGSLEKEISWYLDIKHGPAKYYDETGKKVTKTIMYYDGEQIL